jgi:hypothetical protein
MKIDLLDGLGINQRTIHVSWLGIRKWPWIIANMKRRSAHGRATVLGIFVLDEW